MKVQAIARNIKISPRKVRLVADSVKKQEINRAISYLTVMDQRAARPIKKTLESAIANAVNNMNIKKTDLEIEEIYVSEGIAYKRYHYAARGRIRPYKRRTSHITVTLTTKAAAAVPVKADAPVEEVKKEEKVEAKPKRNLLGRRKKEETK